MNFLIFRDFSRIFIIFLMNLFGFIWNLKRIKIIKTSHADVAADVTERTMCHHVAAYVLATRRTCIDVSFLCVVKTQRRWSNKIYKNELTKTRYNNQVLGKYRVDPQRAGLTLIAELTWSNLGLKEVLNKRK